MPHFDHFPPPEEIDPYDVIVMSTSGPDDIFLRRFGLLLFTKKWRFCQVSQIPNSLRTVKDSATGLVLSLQFNLRQVDYWLLRNLLTFDCLIYTPPEGNESSCYDSILIVHIFSLQTFLPKIILERFSPPLIHDFPLEILF